MNTGELKKCERQHFTDWHWAQWKQAKEKFRSDSADYFGTRSPPAVPGSCPLIAAVEITRLSDYERRWMWEFHAFYFWFEDARTSYAPRHRLEAYAIKVVDLQLSLSEKSFNSDLELTLGRTPVTRKSLEY